MHPRLTAAALAVAASAVLAAPAAAKPVRYAGTTSGGTSIAFTLSGGKVRGMDAMVPTVCVPTRGEPRAGMDFYRPPGALALGGERRASELQESAMHYSEVTKNYRVTARRKGARAVTGKLHMNFAMQTLDYSQDLQLVTWICQGDATFKARPARRR